MKRSRIEKLLEKFPSATVENLYKWYVTEQKSLPVIYKEFGLDFRACQDLLKHYGISIRNISESRLTKSGKEKIKQSFISKYGVENPSQLESVKEKKRQTFLKHYGVDNIWKSKKYYEWLTDYMLLKYGVKRISTNGWGWSEEGQNKKQERIQKLWKGRDKWWISLSDEEQSEFMRILCSSNTSCSKIEDKIQSGLDRLHIRYKRWVGIGNKNFDFKVSGTNILIEVNGDFWHANPKIYKAEDIVSLPGKPVKAENIWMKDIKKRLTAESNGYKLLTVWESELNRMSDEQIDKWLITNIL